MKKYFSLLAICFLVSFGFVFGAPEDHDESFQTFNEIGVTNANIAANGVVNVSALAPDGKILIGGDFTLYKGSTVNRLARINNNGTLDATFNPIVAPLTASTIGATGGFINTIVIAPGGTAENYSFFIGGTFTKYNNIDRNRLAKINCTTTSGVQTCVLDPDFNKVIAPTTAANTGANNVINAIVIFPGGDATSYSVLVGGTFTKFDNIVQNRVAKIVCSTAGVTQVCSLDEDFIGTAATDGADNAVETIVMYNNGVIVLGGAFAKFDGIQRNRVVQLDDDGRVDENFYNVLPFGPDNIVQHLLIQTDGKIIVSGLFDSYSGLFAGRIVRLKGMTSTRAPDGCTAGLFYCSFNSSCVANQSQCASCPADFTHKKPDIAAESFVPPQIPAAGSWAQLPSGKYRRGHFAMVVFEKKIYVFGGGSTKITEVYDPITRTWSEKSAYPGTAAGVMAAAYRDKIYVFNYSDTYEYDPRNDIWIKKANIPTKKTGGTARLVDDKIYILSTVERPGNPSTAPIANMKLYVYDPIRDTWSTETNIPNHIAYTESVVLGGKIYIVGGAIVTNNLVHKKVYQYDTCTRIWRNLNDLPSNIGAHSVAQVGSDIYFGGGTPVSIDRNNGVTKKWNKYSPFTTNGATVPLTDMPLPLYAHRSVSIDGLVYVMGDGGTKGTTGGGVPGDNTTTTGNFTVYNTGISGDVVDDSISACNCQPACGEGKYYSVRENICRPNHELTLNPFCNNNNLCEIGESCNCSDCTNGGFDDKDACGLSSGTQMYCSRDDEFYFPFSPSSAITFTDSALFLSETKSTTFSYESFMSPNQSLRRILGPVFSFGANAPSIKGYDVSSTYGDDRINFVRRKLLAPNSVNKLPTDSYYLNNVSMGFNSEKFDLLFQKDIHAFGIEIYEPMGDNTLSGCNSVCGESTFTFELYDNGVLVDNTIKFSPSNNQDTFFGFWSPHLFDEVRVRETTTTAGSYLGDNEFFGRIYYQDRSAGAQQCETKKVIAMNTSNGTYANNNATMFFDFVPREVSYDGKKVYVYKILKKTTASKASIIANPSEAYKNATDAANTFDFIEANLTPTNAPAVFDNTNISYVNGKLLGRLKADGTLQYQYNDASGGYPFFARTPYRVTGDKVYSQYRDDAPNSGDCPGGVCYALAPVVGVFDVEVCQPDGQDICSIGACCPAGKKWDCDTNACILDEMICPAGKIKTVTPESPVCILNVVPNVTGTSSDFFLTGYEHTVGNCTLASSTGALGTLITPMPPSTSLSVSAETSSLSARANTVLPLAAQVTSLLTCPTGNTVRCSQGDALGTVVCGCYASSLSTLPDIITDPEYTCEIQGCLEGQYFCQSEGICKSANQTCGTVTCNSDGMCDENESCNCVDCNNQADHCGLSSVGEQLTCTQDSLTPVSPSGTTPATPPTEKWVAYQLTGYPRVYLARWPINPTIVGGSTFYVYNPERLIASMTKAQFLANPAAAINAAPVLPVGNTRTPQTRLQFNLPQLLSETPAVQATTINNFKSSILSRFLCKTPVVGATDCHFNNQGVFIPGFSYTPDGTIYSSIHDGNGFIQTAAHERFGIFEIPCQPYDYTTVRYIPNTDPRTQGWATSKGIGTPQNDAGKLVWQVNDASGADGSTASIYKKLAPDEATKFMTEGGKLSASIKNISSGTTASPDNVYHLISSYFELTIGNGAKSSNGTIRPVRRYTLTFGLDANRVPTVYGLTDDHYSTNPTGTPFKYKVEGGADKYNIYEMVYDPANATVDVFVNGVERISNYPGNNVFSGNISLASASATAFFGSGSSAGIAKTNYGEIKLTLKNDACTILTPPVVAQVGACCPTSTQWNSVENKCVPNCPAGTSWDEAQKKCAAPTCAEGQYYCHSELKCKSANQTCGTVTCNNNGTCDLNESCDCADCNGKKDHCGMVKGEQLFCTKDPAPQCYTDRFPYCFPLCLDGYTLDIATNKCVVSGGASVSPNSGALSMTQIGACCPAGAQWSSANNKCETNCTTTQAPSELKAGVDQPYISCTAGPSGTTHFRYRLTDISAPTATPFVSAIYPNGTQVLHSVINNASTYKVECFYGSAASVETSNTATPSTCTKNITVKNDTNTQGCEGLVSYKGSTLTTTLEDTNIFTARFQCINRISENPLLVTPFRIQYADNNFVPLGFATVIDPNLSSSIGLNRLSGQNEYTFGLGHTSVTCAVRVGDGYSTNTSCQKNACVGAHCSTPQTFSVVHSDNLTCTTKDTAVYKIGCNPDAPQTNRTECVNWLKQMANSASSFKAPFIFNGTLYGQISCQKYLPNDPALGGVNMYDNVVCRAELNNGQQYTILAADTGGNALASLQTTTYTVKKDGTDPQLLPLELYLNPSLTLQVTDFDRWYNVPVTLVARCNDQPGISDGDECACAPETLSDPTLWTRGVPHAQFGPDIMYYTRTISASISNISAQVKDTAGNPSNISPQISLNIDTQPPVVAVTETGSGASRTIQLSVTDTNSKIWANSSIPSSGGQNNGGVIYRTGSKDDIQNLMLDTDCGVGPVSTLPTVAQTVSIPSNKVITIPNINTSNTVVTYCVKDNAGNVTRGSYPTMSNACFSSSNMSTMPNFDTYKDLLISRLTTNKYGYSFSENTADAQCFRGILANNVATLVANQLVPSTQVVLDNWDTSRAFVRNTNNRNTNGYYYYSYSANNTLKINTSPSDSGTKTVIVDGGNIQITQDINYSGAGKLLVLIARKNNSGQGGNILIDPTVSHIDAILIADGGALMNTDSNALGDRLVINGRLYSYNTRGGSLTVSGADLADAVQSKKFNNSSLVNALNFTESRTQDLERFRTMTVDGNTQCSLHINYQVLTNSQLPPILQRPTTFGGSCGF